MKIPPRLARLLYWTSQRLRGRAGVRERLELLNRTQWMSPAELAELQMIKLRSLLEHAGKTVPYYRRAFDERGITPRDIATPDDLRKLPLLTRSTLRREQQALLSTEADFDTLEVNFSSGSTGVRAEFRQDLDFRLWMRAHQLRTYAWCGEWKLGEPFALLWGSEVYWSAKQLRDEIDNLLSNRRELNTFRLTPRVISGFVDTLSTFRPVLISSYTNAMMLIVREAARRKIRWPSLRAIQCTSEPVPPPARELLARTFGCRVFDKYGSRETNIVSHESPNNEQMCIQSENIVVEILRDDGTPCAPGEIGRLVLTTLNNRSMPLIRYETSDLASPVAGYCSSGIGLPRMSHVAGRLQDLIFTPDGAAIDAYFFSYLFMRFPEIHWFQVVQREPAALLIRLLAPEGISKERAAVIEERIEHHCGYRFRLEFEVLDEMPPSPTAKFRLCVSELPREHVPADVQQWTDISEVTV